MRKLGILFDELKENAPWYFYAFVLLTMAGTLLNGDAVVLIVDVVSMLCCSLFLTKYNLIRCKFVYIANILSVVISLYIYFNIQNNLFEYVFGYDLYVVIESKINNIYIEKFNNLSVSLFSILLLIPIVFYKYRDMSKVIKVLICTFFMSISIVNGVTYFVLVPISLLFYYNIIS